jgi:RimJ/RimL family protein N-acetyltransferase
VSRPRLSGPRVVLVPAPHAVAVAVATGADPAPALAPLGVRPGPGWPHADSADALRPHAEHGDPVEPADVWLVVDGDEVVGDCGLAGGLEHGEQEIGYGLTPAARGQGLGTEAVAVLCAWLEQQPGVRRVVAEVEVGNAPSQRLLARLGFVPQPAVPPYERWVRGEPRGAPAGRLLPEGHVVGRHVC